MWREALLAQKVLRGRTRGYRHHPQLARFRAAADPEAAIATYLAGVLEEAKRRGYTFDGRKIGRRRQARKLPATRGQLEHEWRHLKRKLRLRSPEQYRAVRLIKVPSAHPSFRIVAGRGEGWERK